MFGKVDLRRVVRDHYRTLRDERTGRTLVGDWLLFLVAPGVVAGSVAIPGGRLGTTAPFLTAVGALTGFLFGVMLLTLSLAGDAAAQTQDRGVTSRGLTRVRVLRDVTANVAYCLVVSLLLFLFLVAGTYTLPSAVAPVAGHLVVEPSQPAWYTIFSVWLLAHTGLTLLMVLKRLYAQTVRQLDMASVSADRDTNHVRRVA